MTSAHDVTRNIMAGAVSGAVAESMMHPFDTVSTRLKVQAGPPYKYHGFRSTWTTILREEGLRGLFSGVHCTLLLGPPAGALYFASYEYARETTMARVPAAAAPAVHLAAGAFSELASSLLVVPTEVVRTRLQLGRDPARATGGFVPYRRNYRHVFDAIASIARKEGAAGLFAGYRACILLDCCYSGLQFAFYEQCKATWRRAAGGRSLRGWESLVVGGVAGGVAAFVTNPLDLVTCRLMAQGQERYFAGILQCARAEVAEAGVAGLWTGAVARVLYVAPLTAISFAVFEHFKRVFHIEGEFEDL